MFANTDGMDGAVMERSPMQIPKSRFKSLLPMLLALPCACLPGVYAQAASVAGDPPQDEAGLTALVIACIGIVGLILIRKQSSLL